MGGPRCLSRGWCCCSSASSACGWRLVVAVSEVYLQPWERAWAQHVGEQRDLANANKGDAPYYDPARMEDNVTASVAAACAELAVAKLLNKYWDGSYWAADEHRRFRDAPDVGRNTEVRRVRKPSSPLPVRARDVERERIMVLAYPVPDEFVVVKVIGYGFARDLWEVGAPADYDREGTTRLVPQGSLKLL